VAQVAILVLGGAVALRQMGLANEIINLAFGLLLGAVALATGLAFGLGGREVAGEELRDWRNTVRSGEADRAATASVSTTTSTTAGTILPPTPPAPPPGRLV
jgi:hypothetical protein